MQDIRQKTSDIRLQIEKKVLDSYLLSYIDRPVIDEDKLLFLITVLDQLELSDKEIQNFTLSTMLIQIALDTHELIRKSSINDEKRQLTVLAGDYFSGLYYKLLADSEDILMIKSLSSGIKEINENKIRIYQNVNADVEQLMNSLMIIESSLFLKLAEYFKFETWNEVIANLLFFKRLLKERSLFIQAECSIFFEALAESAFGKNGETLINLTNEQKYQLIIICERYLEYSKQTIQNGLKQLPRLNELLEDRISSLLNQYQSIAKTFVEEG